MGIMLRKFFGSTITTKGGFQKYSDVPNVHLGLHYKQDMENFATTYNSTTMMGELKQHAAHTNSHENDLQLLKAISTSQTLRFLLDDTFSNSESDPRISKQLHEVVDRCPMLKERFLGRHEGAKHDLSSDVETDASQSSGIDIASSLFLTSRVGSSVPLKHIKSIDREADLAGLHDIYFKDYHFCLRSHPGLHPKVHYWVYFTGKRSVVLREFDGQYRLVTRVNWFVRLRNSSEANPFYRVRRIFTMTVGTMVRVFSALDVLHRDASQEIEAAPHRVYKKGPQKEVIRIKQLDPTIFHFVSKGVIPGGSILMPLIFFNLQ